MGLILVHNLGAILDYRLRYPVCGNFAEKLRAIATASRVKMPVRVNPAIRFSRYAALLLGLAYGYNRNEYLKPIAAHEREVEALRAKERAELEEIRKAEAAKVPLF
ncbi:hypothetical protein ACROYT_G004659 [Oculina patagonica]